MNRRLRAFISGNIVHPIDGFFFARRAAWPFGLMRAAWAGIALIYLLRQWFDIDLYYTDAGFLPRDLVYLITRQDWVFSILFASGESWYAWMWYLITLCTLTCSMLGIAPRMSTITGYVVLASLHERNAMILGGGDTVLRTVGFILMLAPGIDTLSLSRLRKQYIAWKGTRMLLPQVTMPAWPYRLLLWQVIVIYLTSLWWKLLGDMWWDGSAVGAALHHMVFINWSYGVMNVFMPFAVFANHATLLFEAMWALLLIPSPLWQRIPLIGRLPIKRLLLAAGLLFHGSIALLMDVGCFPFAMLVTYLGLLDENDRAWLKRFVDRRSMHPIDVLYDGSCRLCRRSAFSLKMLDTFSHLRLTDFRDTTAKKKIAPHLSTSQLDLAMHILLPDGSMRTGFDAFRCMSWHLPVLWLKAPFLYLPGISQIGRDVYARIARNRQKCVHDRC
jgi:predicted DCC family thiol-disulfide oxidoreductase YuxK